MPIPPKVTIPFTQEKYDFLRQEITRLQTARDEANERVKVAREMGDLSENGAYHYGKFELASISRQLRSVQYQLAHGVVTSKKSDGTVGFGSTVSLQNAERVITYMIVSQFESDPRQGKISVDSPIGNAVLGKRVGDIVKIHVPAGTLTYTVISIT